MVLTRYIYGLTDDHGIVHYIGITTDLEARLKQHVSMAHHTENYPAARRVSDWINDELGHAPGIMLLDVASPKENGLRLERFHIEAHREAGFPLLNVHPRPRKRPATPPVVDKPVDKPPALWTCPFCGFCVGQKQKGNE